MTTWILSIVGVSFLGVLIDVIAPNGKTNKFIKSIFSIAIVVILITPIASLFNKNFSEIDLTYSYEINSDYFYSINQSKYNLYLKTVNESLINEGIEGVNVIICADLSKIKFDIEKVIVDTSNLVLTENITNTNKYNKIRNIIIAVLNVSESEVVFDE